MPKLPDPTKPSTRRVDIKPAMAARVTAEIDDPTKVSTSALSPIEDEARREELKEKEKA